MPSSKRINYITTADGQYGETVDSLANCAMSRHYIARRLSENGRSGRLSIAILTNQGPELRNIALGQWTIHHGNQIRMILTGNPTKNVYRIL